MSVAIGVAIWKSIPPDPSPPPVPIAKRALADLPSVNRLPDSRPNSPVPRRAATIFVSLAAQLRGGERAALEIDGEDGWRLHEPAVHYMDPRRIPAGVPLFIRIVYSGTTFGERSEARSFDCSSILTFVVNRRYNLWCGEKDDVVMTRLE